MARLSGLLSVILAVVSFSSVSTNSMVYTVTFALCTPGLTCPVGNPPSFNRTFVLNGTLSPNVNLTVGDRLEFDLATNVTIHPLTICQNSVIPNFCQGASGNNVLNVPITLAGTNTSVTFNMAGTYYYGCLNHPGMGATISVTQASTGHGHKLSAPFMFIAIIALFSIIFK